jgi:hypothetical protein
MYLKEVGCESVDWIHLAQDSPLTGICQHCSEIKGGEFLD